MGKATHNTDDPTIIKKYANRRLYDTGRSSYVTLDDLCEMIQKGYDFVVVDAKSGDDLTRSVLTQIIVDQESKGDQNLLPTGFLRKLISFYGDTVQTVVPNYLEHTLDIFVKNQERLRGQINKSFDDMRSITPMGGIQPMKNIFKTVPALEEINKKNMQMFERTMKAFTPFSIYGENGSASDAAQKISELKDTIKEMEKELKKLSEQVS